MICRYCKENVLRKDVDKHERHDCNEAPAQCEFQAVGCNQDKVIICFCACVACLFTVVSTCWFQIRAGPPTGRTRLGENQFQDPYDVANFLSGPYDVKIVK